MVQTGLKSPNVYGEIRSNRRTYRNHADKEVAYPRSQPMWRKNDGKLVDYSTKTAWDDLRTYSAKVEWHKLVWFTQSIPSHMFVVWLAIHERLQTQDRMLKWNKDPNLKCPLCEVSCDSHQHLFFQCTFSKEIWSVFLRRMQSNCKAHNWKDIVSVLANEYKDRSIKSVVGRLMFGACVYYIWQERNTRLFAKEKRDKDQNNDILHLSRCMSLNRNE
ncbi:RNA-directed DNA polymerase, eukaryota, reverse transcriptase zinc-binding domain protein [Tanacetum coccineum]